MERRIKDEAARIVNDTFDVTLAEDIISETLHQARETIKRKFREIGLEFREEDW